MISRCVASKAAVLLAAAAALAPLPALVRVVLAAATGYATASIPLAFSLGVLIADEAGSLVPAGSLLGLPPGYAVIALVTASALISMARNPPPRYRLEALALPAAALGAFLGGFSSCIDLARPILAVLAAQGLPGILQAASLAGGFSWPGLALLSLAASIAPLSVRATLPARRALALVPGRWPPSMLAQGPILGGEGLACAILEPKRLSGKLLVLVDSNSPWKVAKCLGVKPDTVLCPACRWREWRQATGLPVRGEDSTGGGVILFEGAFPADVALAGPPPAGRVVVVDLTGSPPPAGGWRQVASFILRSDADVIVVAQRGPPREAPPVGGRIPVVAREQTPVDYPSPDTSYIAVDDGHVRVIIPCTA